MMASVASWYTKVMVTGGKQFLIQIIEELEYVDCRQTTKFAEANSNTFRSAYH